MASHINTDADNANEGSNREQVSTGVEIREGGAGDFPWYRAFVRAPANACACGRHTVTWAPRSHRSLSQVHEASAVHVTQGYESTNEALNAAANVQHRLSQTVRSFDEWMNSPSFYLDRVLTRRRYWFFARAVDVIDGDVLFYGPVLACIFEISGACKCSCLACALFGLTTAAIHSGCARYGHVGSVRLGAACVELRARVCEPATRGE